MKDPKKQAQAQAQAQERVTEEFRRMLREDLWIKLVLKGEDLTEPREMQMYTDCAFDNLLDTLRLIIIPLDFNYKPIVRVNGLVLNDRMLLSFRVSNALNNLSETYVNATTGVMFRGRTPTVLQLEFNFVRRQKSRLNRGNYETPIVVDESLEEAVKTSLSLLEREYDIDMQRFLDNVRNL